MLRASPGEAHEYFSYRSCMFVWLSHGSCSKTSLQDGRKHQTEAEERTSPVVQHAGTGAIHRHQTAVSVVLLPWQASQEDSAARACAVEEHSREGQCNGPLVVPCW